MSECQDRPTFFPEALWKALMNLPALRYMKAPVFTEAELYEKYPIGNEKGTFAFVHNENTFYTYHPRGWHHGEWKPISADSVSSFFDIDAEFLKEGDILVYDSNKKKFVVKSGNVWNKLLGDLKDTFSQVTKFLNQTDEIPTEESDSGIYFVHKDENDIQFRALYLVLGNKAIKIFANNDYYNKESVESMLEDERYYVDAQIQRLEENMSNLGIRKTYPSYEAMQADVNNPIGDNGEVIRGGELVMVVNPDDITKDGVYRYKIVNNVKSWEYASGIGIVGELNKKVNKDDLNNFLNGNRWVDPYFQQLSTLEDTYAALVKWNNSSRGVLSQSDEYGSRTINITDTSVANTYISAIFDLRYLGIKPNDIVSIGVYAKSSTSRARFFINFMDADNNVIGSSIYSNAPLDVSSKTRLYLLGTTIPANSVFINISFERYTGLDIVYFSGLSINFGNILVEVEPSSLKYDDTVKISDYNGKYANRWVDPYFQQLSKLDVIYSSLIAWNNVSRGDVSDPDQVYGTRKIRIVDTVTANTYVRATFDALQLGIIGNAVIAVNTDVTQGRIYVVLEDKDGNSATTIYSTAHQRSGYRKLTVNINIDENVRKIHISFERVGTTDMVSFWGLTINYGTKPVDLEPPRKTVTITSRQPSYLDNLYPNKISLLLPNAATTNISAVNGSVYTDSTLKLSENKNTYAIETSATGQLVFNFPNQLNITTPHSIGMWVYVHDITAINQLELGVYSNGTTAYWSRTTTTTYFGNKLSNGWNLVRFNLSDGNFTNFGVNIGRIRLVVYANKQTKINLGCVFTEASDKARIIFVNDHGRRDGWYGLQAGQTQNAIKDCEDRNMPITFALNPQAIENNDPLRMSITELNEVRKSPIARFSFHSYAVEVTGDMNETQLKADVQKSVRWLEANGFGKPIWRAAHTRNEAPAAPSTLFFNGLVALATYLGNTGNSIQTHPFKDRSNLVRYAITNQTNVQIDDYFTRLKSQRGVGILYTHAILADNTSDATSMTLAEWNYLLSKIDTALSEEWIELIGYDELNQFLLKCGIQDNDVAIINRLFDVCKLLMEE